MRNTAASHRTALTPHLHRHTPGANCLRIVPNSAVKFLTYEHVSRCVLGMIPGASGN